MNHTQRIIAYWKRSLQDAERDRLTLRAGNHIRVAIEELASGQLAEKTADSLFQLKANQSRRATPSKPISIVVAPIIATRGSGKGGTLCPLFLAAKVERNGRLRPQPRQPWIPRRLLEPTPTSLSLGQLTAVNDFYSDTQLDLPHPDASNAWQKAYAHAQRLLNEIGHNDWDSALKKAGYNISQQAALISPENRYGIAANILRVYDYLLENNVATPLLDSYLASKPPTPQLPLTPNNWAIPAQFHVGSFSKKFALSPSQRVALYNLLDQPPTTTLAISGPPGTGKTTLLHSVIASLWVKAALDEVEPPIIVVASTNNQAVTNVIDSLSRQTDIERWLPIPSFGLYLVNTPDKQQEAQANGLLTLNKFGDGFPKTVERASFVNQATPDFLSRCTQHFKQPVRDLNRAVQLWHGELFKLAQTLTEGIKIGYRALASQQEHEAICQEHGSLANYLAQKRAALTAVQPRLKKWLVIETAWKTQQQAEPWYFALLPFMPAVKQQRAAAAQTFAQTHLAAHKLKMPTPAAITDLIQKQLAAAKKDKLTADQAYDAAQLFKKRFEADQVGWQTWVKSNAAELKLDQFFDLETAEQQPNPANLFNCMDTTQRHGLFQAATHYWEARWLLLAEDFGDGFLDRKESRNEATQAQKWYRYGMLTPCFVTTMHTGPSFFDYYNGRSIPLLNHIDLLIVDEAGQVAPELSGAMFALAKQAMVVGDIAQIQPVWSVTEQLDIINLQEQGLAKSDKMLENRFARGLTASQGSVMHLAQAVSPLQLEGTKQRGLFLAEHRRSVPQIINYCNELAYNGRLRPLRPTLPDHPWPHLGYLDVAGRSQRIGGSRQNLAEAQAIGNWLAANQGQLEAYYQADLDDIVAILTPFAAQRRLLQQQLAAQQFQLSKVGTIHTMQGAERPFILFSSVYTKKDPPHYFFDQSPNMLNVAVSRAQDSFFVFGDIAIFKPKQQTPSGLLARHLFASPQNDISLH